MRCPQLPPDAAGKNQTKNKKPAGAICASGPMSAWSKEKLCTPHRTRPSAGMMVMPMGVKNHAEMSVKKTIPAVNRNI
jgi:hypothetical protein